MKLSYREQTLETPNPIARFAHRARYARSMELVFRYLGTNGTLLDFGCGDGTFLARLAENRPGAKLFGFEPAARQQEGRHVMLDSLDDCANGSVDVLCCFETLEHLYDHERQEFYRQTARLLSAKGVLLVSVPIIGGPTLLLKELNRALLFRRRSEYTLHELLRASFLGIPAQRPGNPRPTHKGFDFRALGRELCQSFAVVDRQFSPFKSLPWYLNSQVFYALCANRAVTEPDLNKKSP